MYKRQLCNNQVKTFTNGLSPFHILNRFGFLLDVLVFFFFSYLTYLNTHIALSLTEYILFRIHNINIHLKVLLETNFSQCNSNWKKIIFKSHYKYHPLFKDFILKIPNFFIQIDSTSIYQFRLLLSSTNCPEDDNKHRQSK